MTDTSTYLSFLIRLWREEGLEQPKATGAWDSEIEHIQSGRRWTFKTLNELLDFLRQYTEDPSVLPPSTNE